jgi:hypothetical protein
VPRIEVGQTPKRRTPIQTGEPATRSGKISLSFEFWRQIKYFGLDRTEMDWVIGLLDRLREISRFTKEEWEAETLGNRYGGNRWHYHQVNWNARNIPIQKSNLNWVPSQILDNEDEYAFWQVGFGAGGGRAAGFWETEDRFAIVLLDPHHNLAPSKDYNYKTTECHPEGHAAELLRLAVDRARSSLTCSPDTCSIHGSLTQITLGREIRDVYHFAEMIPLGLEEQTSRDLKELLEAGRIPSLHDVVKRGVSAYMKDYEDDMLGTDGK